MTDVELLKMQVEALEKLIRIKQDTIAELEKQLALKNLPNVTITSQWQVDPCQHEYPTMWGGTTPPYCLKCGKQSYPSYTITTAGVQGGTYKARS